MIKDYIACLGLIFAFMLTAGLVQKAGRYEHHVSLIKHIKIGVIYGLLGSGLLLFSISMPGGGTINIGYVAAIIAARNGRAVSLGAACLIMWVYQLFINGAITGSESISLAALVLFLLALIQFQLSDPVYFLLAILGGTAMHTGLSSIAAEQQISFQAFLYAAAGGIPTYFIQKISKRDVELFRSYHKEATTDFLTGVQNVRQFDKRLNSLVRKALLRNEPLSLLLIDIDHFKKINDTYGHITGDFVLKEAAKVLTSQLSNKDFLSRNGGEEFAVLLPGYAHAKGLSVAEALRKSIEAAVFYYEFTLKIQITISIGVATLNETVYDPEELIVQADNALYSAKHAGRNQVCSIHKCYN
ncbi:GGDEF domain-containing protein [Peribacillus saganii]|uniref:GGDEF domain-containing protein n=1 Tax=Peribacillus saganii TaxID=2303992 RepID=A0A372LTF5_9BACI|nr:GGDEF domain-containing protein [Peribacillus saganii]RFU71082.1 GGDEF domain-containing protein [Peribacillus saganii]